MQLFGGPGASGRRRQLCGMPLGGGGDRPKRAWPASNCILEALLEAIEKSSDVLVAHGSRNGACLAWRAIFRPNSRATRRGRCRRPRVPRRSAHVLTARRPKWINEAAPGVATCRTGSRWLASGAPRPPRAGRCGAPSDATCRALMRTKQLAPGLPDGTTTGVGAPPGSQNQLWSL